MARKKLVKAMTAPEMPEQWQTEEDLRTVQRAAEVMANPKRMAKCKALHKEQMEGMEKMMGGKAGY